MNNTGLQKKKLELFWFFSVILMFLGALNLKTIFIFLQNVTFSSNLGIYVKQVFVLIPHIRHKYNRNCQMNSHISAQTTLHYIEPRYIYKNNDELTSNCIALLSTLSEHDRLQHVYAC